MLIISFSPNQQKGFHPFETFSSFRNVFILSKRFHPFQPKTNKTKMSANIPIPSTVAHTRCRGAYIGVDRQRKIAWAKYYEQLGREADRAVIIVNHANVRHGNSAGNRPADIPTHITDEMYEMACELRKQYTCPCCLEQVNKETIKITYCGHIYCKSCLDTLKSEVDSKCAVCRKSI